jgi:hypothetical protein
MPGSTLIENRIAEEKWHKKYSKIASDSFKEMGLLSISVVVYTNKKGQVVVDLLVPGYAFFLARH